VREVMRQESGGRQDLGDDLTTSSAGAMGLMQVMPDTYDDLRQRHALGDDPYDPRDNILAGTAYIREMYDRYGSPGFLAAYNAGPRRLDGYLAGGTELPNETVNYVASVAPRLGAGTPMNGPLAVYADSGGMASVPSQAAALPGPQRGVAASQFAQASTVQVAMEPIVSPGDYATDPPGGQNWMIATVSGAPLHASRPQVAMEPIVSPGDYADPAQPPPPSSTPHAPAPAMQPPEPGFRLVAVSPPKHASGSRPASAWAIQVGAFATPSQAHAAAENARVRVRFLPQTTEPAIGSTGRRDGTVLFRARLTGMSGVEADDACRQLRASGRECMVIPPDDRS
jgi:D-alanyl-D-alanine carboxypeptidase